MSMWRSRHTRQGGFTIEQNGRTITPTSTSLDAVMSSQSMDLIEVGGDSILVVKAPEHVFHPIQGTDPDTKDIQMNIELGRSSSSWSRYLREEYNPELRGQSGLIKYDRMRRSDTSVRSSLRTIKTPILGATWYVQPFDPTPKNKEIARFVSRNLTQYMTYSWTNVLWEALLMLDFGYFIHEKVWEFKEIEGKQRVILKKMAARHPLDVVDWDFDRQGGPEAVRFYDSIDAASTVPIPIEKLAIFTFDGEAGDLTGISVLRSAYKHWYFKENLYKIDAIQKERHSIGIPIIQLPPNFTNEDRNLAHELGENLRTNEKAHVVLPPNWEIMFAKMEGQAVEPLESAKHHTEMIFQNVLAQAIYASAEGDAQSMMELFYKSTRYIADLVRNVMNKYVIPYLVVPNWETEDFPELKVRRLGDTAEARTISFALRNLVGAGIIQVDDAIEEWSREVLDAPMADPTTRRVVSTPQQPNVGGNQERRPGQPAPPGPPRVGPPRQAPAGNTQPGGKSNTGTDQSGG